MENYYADLMTKYFSKKKADDSFLRYLFGKGVQQRKTAEELERADERKRRLQRERSRRYRALKNARRRSEETNGEVRRNPTKQAHEISPDINQSRRQSYAGFEFRDDEDSSSGNEEPPTLCKIVEEDSVDVKLKKSRLSSCSESASDENSVHSFAEPKDLLLSKNISMNLKEFLSMPNSELDYPTVHSLMFHWLQT